MDVPRIESDIGKGKQGTSHMYLPSNFNNAGVDLIIVHTETTKATATMPSHTTITIIGVQIMLQDRKQHSDSESVFFTHWDVLTSSLDKSAANVTIKAAFMWILADTAGHTTVEQVVEKRTNRSRKLVWPQFTRYISPSRMCARTWPEVSLKGGKSWPRTRGESKYVRPRDWSGNTQAW